MSEKKAGLEKKKEDPTQREIENYLGKSPLPKPQPYSFRTRFIIIIITMYISKDLMYKLSLFHDILLQKRVSKSMRPPF